MNVITGRGSPAATPCRWILALAGALLGAVAFAAPAGAAEILTEVEKIVPDSGFCNPTAWEPPCFASELGISVAVDDETLMTAATVGYLNVEYVYQFRVFAYGREAGGRWAPPQALGGYRGWEVGGPDLLQIDVDATRALVGNPLWSDLPHGFVYAFGRDDAGYWSRTDTLRHPEIDYWGAYFGFDVDLRGNTAAIDGRVFEADDGNWAFAQTLDPSLPVSWSQPHDRADFDGQTIVTAGPDFGVQLWERDPAGAWVVRQAIPEPGVSGDAGFGEAVAVDGDVLLIGAPGTDGPGEAAGAVLAYLRGSDGRWALAATLRASDAGPQSRFGDRLVLDGTTALIRAPGADGAVPGGGAVYWFEREPDGRWLERGKLVPSDGYEGDRFAHDFDLSGDTAVIGAPGRPFEWSDYRLADAGAVYVYDLSVLSPLRVVNIASDGTRLDPRESNTGRWSGMTYLVSYPLAPWYGPLSSGDDPDWKGISRISSWVCHNNWGDAPLNEVISFFDEFEVNGQPVAATLRVLADDSAAVLLNGRVLFPEATRNQNYPTCSAFPIGCLENTMGVLDLTRFLEQGTNRLEFRVAQRAGDGYGLNYLGQVVTADSLGDAVTFVPDPSSYYFTGNRSGCPAGFAGKFGFRAQLANLSELTLADLHVQVAELGRGNLVLTEAGATIGAGRAFPAAEDDGYADGYLEPGEWVDVPFTVCLKRRVPFRLLVDVLGSTRVAAPASSVE